MNATEMQYRAFLAVTICATVVALAPLAVSGVRGVSLPDALIAIADKSVVAFAGLLGTIGALLFRQNQIDADRQDTTREAFQAVKAVAATSPPQPGPTGNPGDPLHTVHDEAPRGENL